MTRAMPPFSRILTGRAYICYFFFRYNENRRGVKNPLMHVYVDELGWELEGQAILPVSPVFYINVPVHPDC